MQICALACVKLSFIFFYRRIFCTGNGKVFSAITIAMIVIIIAWAVSFNMALLFICNGHFAAMWTSIPDLNAHCGSLLDWQLGYALGLYHRCHGSCSAYALRTLHCLPPFASQFWYPDCLSRYGSFSYPPFADSLSLGYFVLALCEFGKESSLG